MRVRWPKQGQVLVDIQFSRASGGRRLLRYMRGIEMQIKEIADPWPTKAALVQK